MRRAVVVTAIPLAVLIGLLFLFELCTQTVALLWPSYEVLYLQPDKVLGWKQVPNLHWTWTGFHWYAVDFSVDVTTNSSGFRDLDREPAKSGVRRAALVGDSLIEAVQVPFEKTGGHLLEKKLNVRERDQPWQVLNFGISNYGVGQFLLVWENHVRRHQPQYLFVFVADYLFERTVSLFEIGAFNFTGSSRLRIRPKFRLDHNRLVREEAPDHDEFVRAQNRVIETEFRGQRSRRRLQFVFPYYIDFLRRTVRLSLGGSTPQGPLAAPLDEDVLKLNFKILETLGRDVARNNARMVIVQVPAAFQSNADLSMLLREFCKLNGFAYIALHEYFQDNANGKPITWNYDGHLNEFGNELLARALAVWLANDR